MPRERDDAARLWDMLDSARSIVSLVEKMTFEAYSADRRTKRAVEREIEIIGEAARGVSDTVRDKHPYVPWGKIVAQRHRLAHEYAEIDDELIWRVATVHAPELVRLLTPIVPTPPPFIEGGHG